MKKVFLVILAFAMCFVMVSCGGSGIKAGDTFHVADISFRAPSVHEFETYEDGDYMLSCYESEDGTFSIGVYSDTDEGAEYYEFTPKAYTIEELYDRFVNDPEATEQETVEIDGVKGYVITYENYNKVAVFLYKDRFYLVEVYREDDLEKEDLECFDVMMETVKFN